MLLDDTKRSMDGCLQSVVKRDGRVVDFEPDRITIAASKALKASGTANDKLALTICKDVLSALEEKGFEVGAVPDIELIQDLVENSFIKRGLSKAAKLYILYRAQHDKMREGKKLMMDVQDLVASYIDREDWRVNENSNAGYSYASLLNHVKANERIGGPRIKKCKMGPLSHYDGYEQQMHWRGGVWYVLADECDALLPILRTHWRHRGQRSR